MESQIQSAVNNYFLQIPHHKRKTFFFNSKQNDLIEFKDILELFYYDAEEINPNYEDQDKDLENRKVVINIAFKLYDKLLNIYTTQNDNLSEDQKKEINVINRPENLTLDFAENDLQPLPSLEGDEEVT